MSQKVQPKDLEALTEEQLAALERWCSKRRSGLTASALELEKAITQLVRTEAKRRKPKPAKKSASTQNKSRTGVETRTAKASNPRPTKSKN